MPNADRSLIAIGVGCRIGCAPKTITALVIRAVEQMPTRDTSAEMMLFSIGEKQEDPGLRRAADELGYGLRFLPREALQKVAARVLTHSAVSMARFGVDSVAEAAALVGAGPDSIIVVPRISNAGATCAIAAVLTPLQKLTGDVLASRSR